MGKMILAVLLIGGIAAGYVVWGSDSPASMDLVPSFLLSWEEQQVRALEDQLHVVQQRSAQAQRTAAVGGIDTTSDIEAARKQVRALENELQSLELTEDRAKAKASELMSVIQQFAGKLS